MFGLTQIRLEKIRAILEKARAQLKARGTFYTPDFEHECRAILDTGYQEMKAVCIHLLKYERYRLLGAYYLQHADTPGPTSEAKGPLGDLYGLRDYECSEMATARKGFWDRELSVLQSEHETA